MTPLLSVRRLNVAFYGAGGTLRAVEDVSFDIAPQETVALVGESGCGKSVTALSLLRLIPSSAGRIEADRLRFRDQELLNLTEREMRRLRGGEISMIFQEPTTSLNPVFRIGSQLDEAIREHRTVSRTEARRIAVELLAGVGMPDPEEKLRAFPHELSGGMRQRVMIAMAIAGRPSLLIADEPTTALDVTIQAQILDLLRRLQQELSMAMLLITHDLGVVAEMAHRVLVMYAGRIVEEAPVDALFLRPQHPYTQGLLRSVPRITGELAELHPIPGIVPDLGSRPTGCAFAPRCPVVMGRCREEMPDLFDVASPENGERQADERHRARCFVISTRQGYKEPCELNEALSDAESES